MMSRVFSKVALKAGSVTARFLERFRNLINCIAALYSFLIALGFKLTYKQLPAKYCNSVDRNPGTHVYLI